MGAWIEMMELFDTPRMTLSLPLWERGLKFREKYATQHAVGSLPLWERGLKYKEMRLASSNLRRSPCGSVD